MDGLWIHCAVAGKWWKYYSEYTETHHRRLRVQVHYRCDQVCCQILGGLQASHQLMMMMKITWAASSFSSRMNATYQVCHGTACTRTYIAPIFEMISVHAVHTISWHIEIEDFVQSLGISSFSWTKAQNISIEQTWLQTAEKCFWYSLTLHTSVGNPPSQHTCEGKLWFYISYLLVVSPLK